MGMKEVKAAIDQKKDFLEILKICGGYYECPKDEYGKRLGPLVGYAGIDKVTGKHFVGDVYVNFAKAEEYPLVLKYFAKQLELMLAMALDQAEVFLGAPMGGLAFAQMLALVFEKRYLYPEKEPTKLKTPTSREESKLIFNRHELQKGDRVVWVEDVCNNFSTTEKGIKLVEEAGGKVMAIICGLNRSLQVQDTFMSNNFTLPVISVARKKIEQYSQDDLSVTDDVAKNNVIWKPKDQWNMLMDAMNKNK